MAKTGAERIANYRARRKSEGMTTLSLVVPSEDVELFKAFAAQRRQNRLPSPPSDEPDQASTQWGGLLGGLTPGASQCPAKRADLPQRSEPSQAEILVDLILNRIIELGWPVGLALGTESELMKTYTVSRAVLRQAIRLLERDSIARVQRGASGGLVVARPDLQATIRAIKVYLEYAGISPREILTTRRVLELAAVDMVIARLNSQGEERLREQIARETTLDGGAGADELQRFHFLLGELSGDVALRLFMGVVLQLADTHSTFHVRSARDRDEAVERVKRLHAAIAEALIARDSERAKKQMAHYIAGVKAWLV